MSFAQATNYYFAAAGDDINNSCMSEFSPWKSIEKLNSIMTLLNPGDSVLFRRGDVFDGEIRITRSGTVTSSICFGAYGLGAKPVINGTKKVSNWKNAGNNKWETICNSNVVKLTNLFINGSQQPLGRWPNVTDPNRGYLWVKWASGKNKLSSHSIPDGSWWKGAELVVRTQRWVLDRVPILSTNGDTLTIEPTSYNISSEFGFFVCNHPATLDKTGEWCFDKETKKLTLYSEANPALSVIEVSTIENLISIKNQNFIVIENLVLEGASTAALMVVNSKNITIRNTDIVHSGVDGVCFRNCGNTVFEYNKLIGTNNQSLDFQDCHGSVVSRNEIKNNGLIAGMGINGSNSYNAMVITGSSNMIAFNKIDSTGYIPLRFEGDSVTIQHNIISNYCMVKDDGGGIYTWGAGDGVPNVERKIIGNIVRNAIGAGHGTADSLRVSSEGIYIDDTSTNVEIIGNTVYKCGNIGIFIHNANHVVVLNNLVYDNGIQLQMLGAGMPLFTIRDCIIKNNTFVSRTSAQKIGAFLTDEPMDSLKQMGVIDSNYYCRPADPQMIMHCLYKLAGNEVNKTYSLSEWKDQYGYDQNSLPEPIRFRYKINLVASPQKITYGFYHDGKDTWYDEKSTEKDDGKKAIADLTGSSSGFQKGMNKFMILSTNIDFKKGEERKYLLRFDTKGVKSGEIIKANFKTKDNQIVCSKEFRLKPSFQTNELLYVPAFANTPFERVNFEFSDPKSTVWIRNITFQAADVTIPDPNDHFLFLVNESNSSMTVPIKNGFVDVSGKVPAKSVILQPYSSAIFFKK